jgi:hypothetical protein
MPVSSFDTDPDMLLATSVAANTLTGSDGVYTLNDTFSVGTTDLLEAQLPAIDAQCGSGILDSFFEDSGQTNEDILQLFTSDSPETASPSFSLFGTPSLPPVEKFGGPSQRASVELTPPLPVRCAAPEAFLLSSHECAVGVARA